ncbi:MAG: hypothetical protein HYY63_05190, partial [Elusimicrobia bacterium]|nr:hypothetical protein [Elusimicrobiota bacterium]
NQQEITLSDISGKTETVTDQKTTYSALDGKHQFVGTIDYKPGGNSTLTTYSGGNLYQEVALNAYSIEYRMDDGHTDIAPVAAGQVTKNYYSPKDLPSHHKVGLPEGITMENVSFFAVDMVGGNMGQVTFAQLKTGKDAVRVKTANGQEGIAKQLNFAYKGNEMSAVSVIGNRVEKKSSGEGGPVLSKVEGGEGEVVSPQETILAGHVKDAGGKLVDAGVTDTGIVAKKGAPNPLIKGHDHSRTVTVGNPKLTRDQMSQLASVGIDNRTEYFKKQETSAKVLVVVIDGKPQTVKKQEFAFLGAMKSERQFDASGNAVIDKKSGQPVPAKPTEILTGTKFGDLKVHSLSTKGKWEHVMTYNRKDGSITVPTTIGNQTYSVTIDKSKKMTIKLGNKTISPENFAKAMDQAQKAKQKREQVANLKEGEATTSVLNEGQVKALMVESAKVDVASKGLEAAVGKSFQVGPFQLNFYSGKMDNLRAASNALNRYIVVSAFMGSIGQYADAKYWDVKGISSERTSLAKGLVSTGIMAKYEKLDQANKSFSAFLSNPEMKTKSGQTLTVTQAQRVVSYVAAVQAAQTARAGTQPGGAGQARGRGITASEILEASNQAMIAIGDVDFKSGGRDGDRGVSLLGESKKNLDKAITKAQSGDLRGALSAYNLGASQLNGAIRIANTQAQAQAPPTRVVATRVAATSQSPRHSGERRSPVSADPTSASVEVTPVVSRDQGVGFFGGIGQRLENAGQSAAGAASRFVTWVTGGSANAAPMPASSRSGGTMSTRFGSPLPSHGPGYRPTARPAVVPAARPAVRTAAARPAASATRPTARSAAPSPRSAAAAPRPATVRAPASPTQGILREVPLLSASGSGRGTMSRREQQKLAAADNARVDRRDGDLKVNEAKSREAQSGLKDKEKRLDNVSGGAARARFTPDAIIARSGGRAAVEKKLRDDGIINSGGVFGIGGDSREVVDAKINVWALQQSNKVTGTIRDERKWPQALRTAVTNLRAGIQNSTERVQRLTTQREYLSRPVVVNMRAGTILQAGQSYGNHRVVSGSAIMTPLGPRAISKNRDGQWVYEGTAEMDSGFKKMGAGRGLDFSREHRFRYSVGSSGKMSLFSIDGRRTESQTFTQGVRESARIPVVKDVARVALAGGKEGFVGSSPDGKGFTFYTKDNSVSYEFKESELNPPGGAGGEASTLMMTGKLDGKNWSMDSRDDFMALTFSFDGGALVQGKYAQGSRVNLTQGTMLLGYVAKGADDNYLTFNEKSGNLEILNVGGTVEKATAGGRVVERYEGTMEMNAAGHAVVRTAYTALLDGSKRVILAAVGVGENARKVVAVQGLGKDKKAEVYEIDRRGSLVRVRDLGSLSAHTQTDIAGVTGKGIERDEKTGDWRLGDFAMGSQTAELVETETGQQFVVGQGFSYEVVAGQTVQLYDKNTTGGGERFRSGIEGLVYEGSFNGEGKWQKGDHFVSAELGRELGWSQLRNEKVEIFTNDNGSFVAVDENTVLRVGSGNHLEQMGLASFRQESFLDHGVQRGVHFDSLKKEWTFSEGARTGYAGWFTSQANQNTGWTTDTNGFTRKTIRDGDRVLEVALGKDIGTIVGSRFKAGGYTRDVWVRDTKTGVETHWIAKGTYESDLEPGKIFASESSLAQSMAAGGAERSFTVQREDQNGRVVDVVVRSIFMGDKGWVGEKPNSQTAAYIRDLVQNQNTSVATVESFKTAVMEDGRVYISEAQIVGAHRTTTDKFKPVSTGDASGPGPTPGEFTISVTSGKLTTREEKDSTTGKTKTITEVGEASVEVKGKITFLGHLGEGGVPTFNASLMSLGNVITALDGRAAALIGGELGDKDSRGVYIIDESGRTKLTFGLFGGELGFGGRLAQFGYRSSQWLAGLGEASIIFVGLPGVGNAFNWFGGNETMERGMVKMHGLPAGTALNDSDRAEAAIDVAVSLIPIPGLNLAVKGGSTLLRLVGKGLVAAGEKAAAGTVNALGRRAITQAAAAVALRTGKVSGWQAARTALHAPLGAVGRLAAQGVRRLFGGSAEGVIGRGVVNPTVNLLGSNAASRAATAGARAASSTAAKDAAKAAWQNTVKSGWQSFKAGAKAAADAPLASLAGNLGVRISGLLDPLIKNFIVNPISWFVREMVMPTLKTWISRAAQWIADKAAPLFEKGVGRFIKGGFTEGKLFWIPIGKIGGNVAKAAAFVEKKVGVRLDKAVEGFGKWFSANLKANIPPIILIGQFISQRLAPHAVKVVDALMVSQGAKQAYGHYENWQKTGDKESYKKMALEIAVIALILFVPFGLGKAGVSAEALRAAEAAKAVETAQPLAWTWKNWSSQIVGKTVDTFSHLGSDFTKTSASFTKEALLGARRFGTLNAMGLGDLMTILPSSEQEVMVEINVDGKKKMVGTGKFESKGFGGLHLLSMEERYESFKGGAEFGAIFGVVGHFFQPLWVEMFPVFRTFSMGGKAIGALKTVADTVVEGSGEVLSTVYSVTIFGLVGTGLHNFVNFVGLGDTELGQFLKSEPVNMALSVLIAPTSGRGTSLDFSRAYRTLNGMGKGTDVATRLEFAQEIRNARDTNRPLEFDGGRSLTKEELNGLSGRAEQVTAEILFVKDKESGERAHLKGVHEAVRESKSSKSGAEGTVEGRSVPTYNANINGRQVEVRLTDKLLNELENLVFDRLDKSTANLAQMLTIEVGSEIGGQRKGETYEMTQGLKDRIGEEYASRLDRDTAAEIIKEVDNELNSINQDLERSETGIKNLTDEAGRETSPELKKVLQDNIDFYSGEKKKNEEKKKELQNYKNALQERVDSFDMTDARKDLKTWEENARKKTKQGEGLSDEGVIDALDRMESYNSFTPNKKKAVGERKEELLNQYFGEKRSRKYYDQLKKADASEVNSLKERAQKLRQVEEGQFKKSEETIQSLEQEILQAEQDLRENPNHPERDKKLEHLSSLKDELSVAWKKHELYYDLRALARGDKTYEEVFGNRRSGWGDQLRAWRAGIRSWVASTALGRFFGIGAGGAVKFRTFLYRARAVEKSRIAADIAFLEGKLRAGGGIEEGSREERYINMIINRLRGEQGDVDRLSLKTILNRLTLDVRAEVNHTLEFFNRVRAEARESLTPEQRENGEGSIETALDALLDRMSDPLYLNENADHQSKVKEAVGDLVTSMLITWGEKWNQNKTTIDDWISKIMEMDPASKESSAKSSAIRDQIARTMFGEGQKSDFGEKDLTVAQKFFLSMKISENILKRNVPANDYWERAVNQTEMTINNLMGRVSALTMGGGKTFAYFWSIDLQFHIGGKGVAELIAAKTTDAGGITRGWNKQMTNALGIETYSGKDYYDLGTERLAELYTQEIEGGSRGRVIVYDMTTRGFVELNARMGKDGGVLDRALDRVNVRIADEADVASLSRMAFVMGSGDNVADKEFVDHIEKLIAKVEKLGAVSKDIKGGKELEGMEFTMKDEELIFSTDLDTALKDLREEIKKETGDRYSNDLIDAQIDHIFRARAALEKEKVGEGGGFVNGQPASVEGGVRRSNTTDQSASYNVAKVVMGIRALERQYGEGSSAAKEAIAKEGLNKYNVKLSESVGESTLSQVFSRGRGRVLTFGGSGTMDVAREIAHSITGSQAVEVQGAKLSDLLNVMQSGRRVIIGDRKDVIAAEVKRVVEFLTKEGEMDYGEVLGAVDPSYLREILVGALRELAVGEGKNETEKRDIAEKFDKTVKELEKKSSSLGELKNGLASEFSGIKKAADKIEIIDSKLSEMKSEKVAEIARDARGKVILTNESGLRGVDFGYINIRI